MRFKQSAMQPTPSCRTRPGCFARKLEGREPTVSGVANLVDIAAEKVSAGEAECSLPQYPAPRAPSGVLPTSSEHHTVIACGVIGLYGDLGLAPCDTPRLDVPPHRPVTAGI